MPSWGIHIYIAKKVSEKLNIDSNDFIIANVLPDVYSGHIIKNMPKTISYDKTHHGKECKINESMYMLPDCEEFIKLHNGLKSNIAVLGYYSHLLADNYFNYYAFKNKYIKDKTGKVVEIVTKDGSTIYSNNDKARITKQQDCAILDYILLNKIKVNNVEKSDDFVVACKNIKSVEINKNDLPKVLDYINDMLQNKEKYKAENEGKEFIMFSEEELLTMVKDCINLIIDKISNL